MDDYNIYALKVNPKYAEAILQSLLQGDARYGWSYVETGDLYKIQGRIDRFGAESLSDDEKACNQRFLLKIKEGDWVVYINVPDYGRCTLARVTTPYYWQKVDSDFNHHIGVDPDSVKTFDRNAPQIHPALTVRLKLQGRWWGIYLKTEFEQLLAWLDGASPSQDLGAATSNMGFLSSEIRPLLAQITDRIHHTHPNYSLETLIAEVLKATPAVKEVSKQGGAGDHGADILAILEQENPITGDVRQIQCVVQVKSFEGEHWDTKAVNDIRRAFQKYPDAESGVIVSTARKAGPTLEAALDQLKIDTGKDVSLLIGEDVALFVLRYGQHLLRIANPVE